jgi:hypothetical protein
LIAHRRERERQGAAEKDPRKTQPMNAPSPVLFERDPAPERTVAVIVPCYQHGRFLPAAIQSLHDQTLPPTRIIVVDDASDDPETTDALNALDRDPLVTVLRLAENSGPSVARNRALAEVNESYMLPLDADDMLPPRALETMVEQLELAPENIGFIYPNVQHFGNRHDYYAAPAYNLDVLLSDNYCAAATLFDRRVFDAGLRYPEDIVFGHEDWDLVLQMAEHHIYGEPAAGPTLMYRKRGFSRVNAVEYGADSFHRRIERRHPLLYDQQRDAIKAEWAPALSLVLIDGCDGSTGQWPGILRDRLMAQSCRDFETICAGLPPSVVGGLNGIRIDGNALEQVGEAVHGARGRFVVMVGARAIAALSRPTFVEQAIRLFWNNETVSHFVLGDVPGRRGPRFAPLGAEASQATPAGVAWRRNPERGSFEVSVGAADNVIEDFILQWQHSGPVEWRAL